MSTCQFLRCKAYPIKKTTDVIFEADRHPGFISHVLNPKAPTWIVGSSGEVMDAIIQYISKPAPVIHRSGKPGLRKRRNDHRCLVAGIVTWPDLVEVCRSRDYPQERLEAFRKWRLQSLDWLRHQFKDNLIAACQHLDESHPHIHFFIVGDAQRLHPGMKCELIENKRLVVPAERFAAHKCGLIAWLDDFHVHVGLPCGLQRKLGARPAWRIKDRGTRLRLLEIDKALAERPDADIQDRRDEIWDSEVKARRPKLVF